MANKRRKGGKIGRPPKIIVNTDGVDARMPLKCIRKCSSCNQKISNNEGILSWETMEFCNKVCLEKFQNKIGSKCTNCNSSVKPARLGKLCVRIGFQISQFCNTTCLNEYRAKAKVCAKCHKDITQDPSAIFADIGSGEGKDFCSEICKTKYIASTTKAPNRSCATCNRQTVTLELELDENIMCFCGNVCYSAYKYSNSLATSQCKSCSNYFENKVLEQNSMYSNGDAYGFCSPACKNRYINMDKTIVQCKTCKIQKYSFDLIQLKGTDPPIMMCSLKCLNANETSNSTNSSTVSTPSTLSNNQAPQKTLPTPIPKPTVNRTTSPSSKSSQADSSQKSNTSTPVTNSDTSTPVKEISLPMKEISSLLPLKIPNLPPLPRNVATMCKIKVAEVEVETEKVNTTTTAVQKDVETNSVEVQTDLAGYSCLPIPIPIYIPVPMMMYSAPYPVPFPFPVPLPVPIFIPTSKRTFNGVTKRIKKILDRSLKDPLQDEMLMLAEMASKDCKGTVSSSDSDTESEEEKKIVKPAPKRRRGGRRASFGSTNTRAPPRRARFSKQNVSYVDYDNDAAAEVLPRAPRRATKKLPFHNDVENDRDRQPKNNRRVMFVEEQNDMVSPYATLNNPSDAELTDGAYDNTQLYEDEYSRSYGEPPTPANRMNDYDEKGDFNKRRKNRQPSPQRESKRPCLIPKSETYTPYPPQANTPFVQKPLPSLQEVHKKPDSEMHLKYFIGVSAWQQWSQTKHPGRFNPDILKLSCEDLDTSLCLFINEVQKPNGQIYTPDTIFYFCLGIQQHLFLNGRTDNIFYNAVYKRFTDCLDEIAKKFLVLYNDSDFIVTRIEEEHLWESKQLGAHSPQVLLNTLLFFNTKYFNLTMVEEHRNLQFSQILKNVKYAPMKSGRTRSVVLRYMPNGRESAQPQQVKSRKKKHFEQFENEENPLRCPIRLYEFYISKCPENVKAASSCFYLLPVSSCLPESSVWYSATPVPDHELEKVLNRFKIIREITMALLAK